MQHTNQKIKSKVKIYFDKTENYYDDNFNIIIRAEAIQDFADKIVFSSILDIGCGNGSGSVQLLKPEISLTLLDVSPNMLDEARKKIPVEYLSLVKLINMDFYDFQTNNNSFDLVLSLGVLAHIDKPYIFIEKIIKTMKPGGYLILQNSDAGHFYFKLALFSDKIKNLFRKNRYGYGFNKIKDKDLRIFFDKQGLNLEQVYRYNQSFLLFSRFISPETKYKLVKKIFGTLNENRHPKWGSECIYFLKKD